MAIQVHSYLTTRHHRNEGASIGPVHFELILQERAKVFFSVKCLSHRFCESPPRRLSKSAQVHNLVLALECPHLIQQWLQWLDLAVINDFFELLRCDCGPVEVSMQ